MIRQDIILGLDHTWTARRRQALRCNIEVDDLAPVMQQDYETVQVAEYDCRNGKKVDGGDLRGGCILESTIPAGLFEIKGRFETWRTNREYMREPIPDELWNTAADLSRRYPPSLVGRVLRLDPSRWWGFGKSD